MGAVSCVSGQDKGAEGRTESVVSPQNKTTIYHYDAVGNRDSVLSPNGTTSGYQYDNLNRLTRVRHYKAGTILAHYDYTLNAAGMRTQVTEKDSSKVFYGYDSLYRLKSERRTGSHTDTMTYTYDPVGNRLTKGHRGVTTTYAYNNRDELLSEWDGTDSTRYSYDSAGRMLTKTEVGGTIHYRWRDEDRLDSLYGPGVSVKYQYDAEGRRVKDSTGSTVRQYLIDPLLPYGQVIAETDGSNSLVAEYTFGTDRVSLRRSGAAHYYLADGQGSTRLLTDSTGTATDSTIFTAFGETLFSNGSTPNDFKYGGEQLDGNSGFYYNRARWMAPRSGRFTSVDPFDGDPQAPVSLHRYLYANQSPSNFLDPSGQITLVELSFSLGIQGALGFATSAGITFAFTKNVKQSLISGGTGFALGVVTGGVFQLAKFVIAARAIAAAEVAAEDIIINEGKIGYLLGAAGGKAAGFEALGYTTANPGELDALLASTRYLVDEEAALISKVTTQYGVKYTVQAGIVGANGKEGIIVVAWQVDKGTSVYKLVTAIAKPLKIIKGN